MNERQETIYALVNKLGNASIEQLCSAVFASPATIRRDLKSMEQGGLIQRVWGGAICIDRQDNDPPLFLRSNINVLAKRAIAKAAADLLHDNATIFLPSGTTVTEFAKHLYRYKGLTVITNSLDVVRALSDHTDANVMVLGGKLYENYDMVGALTENAIDQLNADFFFLSCSGICADGFTAMDMGRLNIMKKMQKHSAHTVLMADTAKIGKKYTFNGFSFDCVDHVVMEAMPEDAALRKALGSKLIVAAP